MHIDLNELLGEKKKKPKIKQDLLYILSEMRKLEITARDLYEGLLPAVNESFWKKLVSGIRDDEIKHIQIVDAVKKIIEDQDFQGPEIIEFKR